MNGFGVVYFLIICNNKIWKISQGRIYHIHILDNTKQHYFELKRVRQEY